MNDYMMILTFGIVAGIGLSFTPMIIGSAIRFFLRLFNSLG